MAVDVSSIQVVPPVVLSFEVGMLCCQDQRVVIGDDSCLSRDCLSDGDAVPTSSC